MPIDVILNIGYNYIMKLKTKTIIIIFGIFCILGISLLINGYMEYDSSTIMISVVTLLIITPLLITYIKTIGKIYCNNNEIIKDIFGKKFINSIDRNLKMKFGIYTIKITNQHNLYLDKNNDDNNVIENIYTYIENNSINNNIIFPFKYKNNNFVIISILFLLFTIIGFIGLIVLNKYAVDNIINIGILFFSILSMIASISSFLLNNKMVFENDKIIRLNAINRKSIIPVNKISKIEIVFVLKKLCMFFHYKNKKIVIELKSKNNYEDIEKLYLLKRYYDEIKNNGHFA
jgi:hypothetical protein